MLDKKVVKNLNILKCVSQSFSVHSSRILGSSKGGLGQLQVGMVTADVGVPK